MYYRAKSQSIIRKKEVDINSSLKKGKSNLHFTSDISMAIFTKIWKNQMG
jgi:hypothetical protein